MKRVGILLTPDNAIDPELWQWRPEGVALHITRLHCDGWDALDPEAGQMLLRSDGVVRAATRSLVAIEPEVVVFACTSGSFVAGLAGEPAIRQSMLAAGAKQALTTGGAVVDALRVLRVRRIAVGAPYLPWLGERLGIFLTEAGFEVASLVSAAPERLDLTSDAQVTRLADAAFRPGVDALFLSCTALATRHLLGPLMARYGVPVVSATQATMWAALAAVGLSPSGPDHPLHHLTPEKVAVAAA